MCCLSDGWYGRGRLSATLCRCDILLILVNKKIDMSMSVFRGKRLFFVSLLFCYARRVFAMFSIKSTVSTKTMFLSYPAHRAHPGSNWGPIDLQSMALPLSYTPGTVSRSPGCFWMPLTTSLGLVRVIRCLFRHLANSVAAVVTILIDGVY